MKKKSLSMLGAGVALGLASMMGIGQATQNTVEPVQAQQGKTDFKATPPKQREKKTRIVNEIGGISLMQGGDFGLTRMEYGLRFGTGRSRKGKTNFLRLAHNSKVSKRINRA